MALTRVVTVILGRKVGRFTDAKEIEVLERAFSQGGDRVSDRGDSVGKGGLHRDEEHWREGSFGDGVNVLEFEVPW